LAGGLAMGAAGGEMANVVYSQKKPIAEMTLIEHTAGVGGVIGTGEGLFIAGIGGLC
jgi:hypothetical protein